MQFVDVAALSAVTFPRKKGDIIIEQKQQFEAMMESNGIPGFRSKNRTYQLLNLGLDVEAGGVTYHLSSEFTGESEMGAVIDMIELERHRRNLA